MRAWTGERAPLRLPPLLPPLLRSLPTNTNQHGVSSPSPPCCSATAPLTPPPCSLSGGYIPSPSPPISRSHSPIPTSSSTSTVPVNPSPLSNDDDQAPAQPAGAGPAATLEGELTSVMAGLGSFWGKVRKQVSYFPFVVLCSSPRGVRDERRRGAGKGMAWLARFSWLDGLAGGVAERGSLRCGYRRWFWAGYTLSRWATRAKSRRGRRVSLRGGGHGSLSCKGDERVQ